MLISNGYPYKFVLLYALAYMCNAVYGTFISIYLDQAGFGRTAIGTLMALGPFVAIIAQPIWGMVGDRAKTKNGILGFLVLGCACIIMIYPLSTSFIYLFFIISAFTFFQTSVTPLCDAITLEYLETTQWKYGPIRLSGTVSFSVMAVATGIFARKSINVIFPIYFMICLGLLLVIYFLPKIKGHQSSGKRTSMLQLFKDRELVILLLFSLSIQSALAYYYSFFPIHFRNLGADNVLIGWAQFVAAMSEIPFLLNAHRIIKKLGIRLTMIVSAFIIAIRLMIFSAVTNIYIILSVNVLHGFAFAVLSYCMAIYINSNVPRELKASGQTLNGLIALGMAKIIGNVFGGILSDKYGFQMTFLFASIFAFAAILIFGCIFMKNKNIDNFHSESV